MQDSPNTFLLQTMSASSVSKITHALTAAGIPFDTGLQAQGRPAVAIFVPQSKLLAAQQVMGALFMEPHVHDDPDDDDEDDDEIEDDAETEAAELPWGAIQIVLGMILLHVGILFWSGGTLPSGRNIIRLGALIPERTLQEPWRLVTSLFLHGDLRHLAWNGVSMLVFAIPLLTFLGLRRTSWVYIASGIGGGVTATLLAAPDTMIIGSSGAVAGLFGAWIGLTIERASRRHVGWRGYVRTAGIALLVLPSLIHPVDASGRSISVTSHMGGLATGVAIGIAISWMILRRRQPRSGYTADHAVH